MLEIRVGGVEKFWYILLQIKAVLKLIGNWFCTLITYKTPIKIRFLKRNMLFLTCVTSALFNLNTAFLIKKKLTFIGLLKIIWWDQ